MVRFLKILGLLTLISVSNVTFSQTSQISIRFIGNCGLYLTDGVAIIYIDFPYKSGSHNYMEYDLSELDSVKGNPIFISGDTEHAETIASLKDIDWAFVPVWLLMDANEKGVKLRDVSKMFAVYHIGPGDDITIDENEQRIKLLNKQGEIITIPY